MPHHQKVHKKVITLTSSLQKNRLPNTALIDQLLAALKDLEHEFNPFTIYHPVVKSKHGTKLNRAIKKMKQLFCQVITTVSSIVNDMLSLRVTQELVPIMAGGLFPKIKIKPKHSNSTFTSIIRSQQNNQLLCSQHTHEKEF